MDRYVVGFAFTEDGKSVLLMEKNRPSWQAGLLNGIGGHIEEGEDTETPYTAMHRETMEEAGITLDWYHRGVMRGTNNDDGEFECHIFYAHDDAVEGFRQIEDEELRLIPVFKLPTLNTIANLAFLIPFGLCPDGSNFMTLKY